MRVALVSGPDAGHTFPVVALAVALRDRGHDVCVVTGTQWAGALAGDGLPFVELPLLAPTPRDADIGYLLWERAGEMAPPLAERLAEDRPDVVVTDTLTRAGAFAAELLRIPWIELSPTFLYEPDPQVPPIGLGAAPPRGPLSRRHQASIRRQQLRSFEQGHALGRRVRRRLGLRGDGQPVARLLATLPELEPARSRWPRRTFVVGAMVWEPPTWPQLRVPRGQGPLVVVSDSTASGVHRDIAGPAAAWLRRDERFRAVITSTAAHEGVPGRVVVGRSRHEPLLRAADVVLGTAGHGLVTKALALGVPLVLVPLQGDQLETVARVVRAGLGRGVSPGRVSPRRLRVATREVLADTALAARVGSAARGAARLGRDRAAALVESVVAASGAGLSPPRAGSAAPRWTA